MNASSHHNATKGYLLILVLVFGAIFFTIISSFTVFIVTQSKLIAQRVEVETAGQIAEAGLNYYKWFLAHYPNDVTNGTGLPGPYVGVYNDPEGAALGEYSLTIASTTYCGDLASMRVTSVGNTYNQPNVKKTLSARYARPTIADYSYILNSNVWVGPDSQITGPYHSNGGIRFDGRNNSIVTSGQLTWSCDSSYGCSPTATQNGVFTTTANPTTALFDYPSAPINFAGVTVDLATIKTKAQNNGGRFFGPSGRAGYYVIFNADGTYEVNIVRGKENEPNGNAWGHQMHILKNLESVGTYAINPACPVAYFEDQVWIEGVVNGKLTLAAADVSSNTINPSIILNDNITYANATSGLLAIAEYDILVGLVVPTDMTLNGIFLAQTGKFGRNNYIPADVPPSWDEYILRNSLTLNGTIVSNGRVGTKWINGSGTFTSGFNYRYTSYDKNLVASPPPLIPNTSDDYTFSDWQDAN
ncbi:MAG: hypothetical protein V4668_01740 [Patescibacteria group bacterium]